LNVTPAQILIDSPKLKQILEQVLKEHIQYEQKKKDPNLKQEEELQSYKEKIIRTGTMRIDDIDWKYNFDTDEKKKILRALADDLFLPTWLERSRKYTRKTLVAQARKDIREENEVTEDTRKLFELTETERQELETYVRHLVTIEKELEIEMSKIEFDEDLLSDNQLQQVDKQTSVNEDDEKNELLKSTHAYDDTRLKIIPSDENEVPDLVEEEPESGAAKEHLLSQIMKKASQGVNEGIDIVKKGIGQMSGSNESDNAGGENIDENANNEHEADEDTVEVDGDAVEVTPAFMENVEILF